jgi:hypothetical protein
MRRVALLYCGWTLALCASADATELWSVVEQVPTVTIRIHWVSRVELLAVARDVGQKPQSEALAFSVLRKNVETGTYTCDVYMPSRPIRTWDKPTLSLGHELAHCLGFVHE